MAIINDVIPDVDSAAQVQACMLALAIAKGEWSFDGTEGVDYEGEVLVKAPNLDRIRAIVRRQLESIQPGTDMVLNSDGDMAIIDGDLVFGTVEAIVEADVQATFNAALRRVEITFTAYTASGKAIRQSVGF